MTTQPNTRSAPLAMNGVAKFPVQPTSWLLTTPAPVATMPLTRVARPMMVERSAEGSADEEADETSHDSKAEKRMLVETPPRTRPRRSSGIYGTRMHTHARV